METNFQFFEKKSFVFLVATADQTKDTVVQDSRFPTII